MKSTKKSILVLTARPDSFASIRFRQSGKKLGISVRAVDPTQCMPVITPEENSIRFGGRRLSRPTAIIPRFGPGNYENGLAMLCQLEALDIPVCNPSKGIELARDTFRSLIALKHAGLSVPRTARILSVKDLHVAAKLIPGPPWIMKTFTGAMGIGTMYIGAEDQLEAVAATLWALNQPILLQEFVRAKDGKLADIRALVIGKKVLGAITRRAATGEYRTNVHRGGAPERIVLNSSEEKLALKAAKASGLSITGVDWIRTASGPVVLEVNATPGFSGFEQATEIDVASAILEFAIQLGKSKK
ncbi:MAG: RimK family alpha-L-glutamate ligase [bacterium]